MNVDTGAYRKLLEGESLRSNEVAVAGDEEMIARLSRNIRRGLKTTDHLKPLEERIAALEAREAERDRQTALRGRARAVGLVLP